MTSTPSSLRMAALLRQDCHELTHSFIRELALATRKFAIYGPDHQVATRSLDAPLRHLAILLKVRTHVIVALDRGQLSCANITIRPSVQTGPLVEAMQRLDTYTISFFPGATAGHLGQFLTSLVRREHQFDPNFDLASHLKAQNLTTVTVNSEFGTEVHENRKLYRGDVAGDFTTRHLLADQIGTDPKRIATVNLGDDQRLIDLGIDYHPELVRYVVPELIARIPVHEMVAMIKRLFADAEDLDPNGSASAPALAGSLLALTEFHPRRADIVSQLPGLSEAEEPTSVPPSVQMKEEVASAFDSSLQAIFAGSGSIDDLPRLFDRLLKTGQEVKAADILGDLIDRLDVINPHDRQTAAEILLALLPLISPQRQQALLKSLIDTVTQIVLDQREALEHAELITALFDHLFAAAWYEPLITLSAALHDRTTREAEHTTYDSLGIRRVFEKLNRPAMVERYRELLVTADHETTQQLRSILSSIGTESLAAGLAEIITHDNRQVRQTVLRILTELGPATLAVVARILADESLWLRAADRTELPDQQWYVVRNSIYVLGGIRETRGVEVLHGLVGDADLRVRREIIAALEKIGGSNAVDLLSVMAEDVVPEIREAALITIGLIGDADASPLVIAHITNDAKLTLKGIAALGRLGGEAACSWLGEALTDPEAFSELDRGMVGKDDLRAALIRALAQTGEASAREQIKVFKESLSTASRLFGRNSAVQKALSDVGI